MNNLNPFKLERYFAKYEFSASYLLSPSDIEPLTLPELLDKASETRREQWENLWLGYTESQGHPELLSLISQMYQDIPSQKIIEVVPQEGIFIAMNTLINTGDHVIVMHPSYQSLYEIARSRGAEVSYWQPSSEWHFDIEQLRDLMKANTRMIVINTPHNPTGAHFTHAEFEEIVAVAREKGAWLFADEMYRLSEHQAENRLPAACDLYEKAISLSGLSKSFALPGLRVGWLATRSQDAMKRFIRYKDYTTICSSALSEILAIIALESQDDILQRNLEIIKANLAIIDEFFSAFGSYFRWQQPIAGTIGFVKWLGEKNVQQLADDLVQQHGIMILPAAVYDYEGNYFRLGFGRRNLTEGLEQFSAYLTD